MAFIAVPEEEYYVCTHFACQFCGKITNISQVLLGVRWDWTLTAEQRPELPHEIQLND